MNFSKFFQKIEESTTLNAILHDIINLAAEQNFVKEQVLSAICHIVLKDPATISIILSHTSKLKYLGIDSHINNVLNIIKNKDSETNVFYKIYYKIELDQSEIQSIVEMSLQPDSNSLNLTVILNLIKHKGLSAKNILTLSIKMAESGKIYDYRNYQKLNNKKIIRRYPTGGVSEKIALIMPSLLKCVAKKYDFVSPFLVAKTLGFTGGTWDKLSSIPDFNFPNPGDESVSILANESVCMTVAKGDYTPSDTFLYQLRSVTNTIESLPLIISSIASKQIANPLDTLLLDIRYGENAFLKDLNQAQDFFKQIKPILDKFKINTIAEYINTENIYGSSIGNYLEVIESICVMKNQTTYDKFTFDFDLLHKQKDLVILMTSKLISTQFNIKYKDVHNLCNDSFNNLEVFESFKEILSSHSVDFNTISKINNNLPFCNNLKLKEFPIYSHKTGVIEKINQKNIGTFVNLQLEAGTNYYNTEDKLYDGILIKKKQNSYVYEHEVIATVFSITDIDTRSLSNNFFKIT